MWPQSGIGFDACCEAVSEGKYCTCGLRLALDLLLVVRQLGSKNSTCGHRLALDLLLVVEQLEGKNFMCGHRLA